jgi:hypothetical protein
MAKPTIKINSVANGGCGTMSIFGLILQNPNSSSTAKTFAARMLGRHGQTRHR